MKLMHERHSAQDTAARVYARSSMKKLGQAVQDKLPRELRNYIYGFLCEPTLKCAKRELSVALCEVEVGKQDWLELPPFALPRYMGPSTADEALAYLYQEAFLEPHARIPLQNVCEFLTADPLGRGFSVLSWTKPICIRWEFVAGDVAKADAISSFKALTELTSMPPVGISMDL